MRRRLLLIGFEPPGRIEYPHVRYVTEFLAQHCDLDYLSFRERGYLTGAILGQPAWWLRPRFYSLLWRVALDLVSSLGTMLRTYDSVVAIDNYAYAMIGVVRKQGLVLWSLDFVTSDQPSSESVWHRSISRICARTLRRHRRLIVQDASRLQLLAQSIGLAPTERLDAFFLPVSLPPVTDAEAVRANSGSTCNQPPRLLQMGGINQHRSCSRSVYEHYLQNRDRYVLRLHGYISPRDFTALDRERHPEVFCDSIVPPDRIPEIVRKADIGLVAYCASDANFRHMASSSGQLVEYLRCGKPVIVYSKSDLSPFVEHHGIGVAVDSIEQLLSAVESICRDYGGYSKRSLAAFSDHFDFSLHSQPLLRWLAST